MADKKEEKQEFVVTDRRRRFDEDSPSEPEQQTPAPEETTPEPPRPEEVQAPAAAAPDASAENQAPPQPPMPSAEERARSNAAYRESASQMESSLRKQYGSQMSGLDMNVHFEDVLEPFYVTALMQLGGGQEGQQRRVDPLGARRTIDTIELLREKMKGNLTDQEADLLEAMLYQLRMAYMDVINALTKPAPNGGPVPIK